MPKHPEVVCICGSSRFADQILTATRDLTLAGAIVLAPAEIDRAITAEEKALLGQLHLRKIDMADRIVVVNPGGYIGESTAHEIAYAQASGKPISFTQPR